MLTLKTSDIDFDWCVNLHEDKESFLEATQSYCNEVFPECWSREEGLDTFIKDLISNI